MKKLIVTADDYGVFPNVNQGVIDAVNKGVVNSVAVFANYDGYTVPVDEAKPETAVKKYPNSLENVKTLLEKTNGKAEIGCHLTITSGKPLTTQVPFLLQNTIGIKRFKEYYELKNYDADIHSRAIKEELVAQVKKLDEAGYKVKHLTCHHDSLTFYPNYYDVYLDVAKSLNLPVRSPDIRPWKKTRTYKRIVMLRLIDDLKSKDRKLILQFADDIVKYFYRSNKNVKTTNYMDSRHYGPPPVMQVKQIDLPRIVEEKSTAFVDMVNEFASAPADVRTMEIMLHLAADEITKINTYDDIDYSGVHRGYFGGRIAEYQSVNAFAKKTLPAGIVHGSWNDI